MNMESFEPLFAFLSRLWWLRGIRGYKISWFFIWWYFSHTLAPLDFLCSLRMLDSFWRVQRITLGLSFFWHLWKLFFLSFVRISEISQTCHQDKWHINEIRPRASTWSYENILFCFSKNLLQGSFILYIDNGMVLISNQVRYLEKGDPLFFERRRVCLREYCCTGPDRHCLL